MKPYFTDEQATLYLGDALTALQSLPDASINCCVTSPPYFGLRDYGVDRQIGAESSPAEFVRALTSVFAEVRRVLADDGTLWLNLGDSFATSGASGPQGSSGQRATRTFTAEALARRGDRPPKNLLGIPWRVAFALQDDGWILRNDVIWAKPNGMPESVTDRLSTKHEHLFLLTKADWRGDAAAADLPDVDAAWLAALIDGEGTITVARDKRSEKNPKHQDVFTVTLSVANTCVPLLEKAGRLLGGAEVHRNNEGVNRPGYAVRVSSNKAAAVIEAVEPWLIDKKDQALIALALRDTQRRAGTSTDSYRSTEGRWYKERLWEAMKAANRRESQDLSWVKPRKSGRWVPQPYWFDLDPIREPHVSEPGREGANCLRGQKAIRATGPNSGAYSEGGRNPGDVWTIPTQPFTEAHFAVFPVEIPRRAIAAGCKPGGVVLDPFSGSGTTGLAAAELGRRYVGIDLNRDYLELSLRTRLSQPSLTAEVGS